MSYSYGSGQSSGWTPSADEHKNRRKAKTQEAKKPKRRTPSQNTTYGAGNSGWTPSADERKNRRNQPKPPKKSGSSYTPGSHYAGAGSSSLNGGGTKSRSNRGANPPGGGRGRGASEGTPKTDPIAWAKDKRIGNAAARRAARRRHGTFRGEYYGPDVFKGDESLNKAWEATKKKKRINPSAFMTQYKRGANR